MDYGLLRNSNFWGLLSLTCAFLGVAYSQNPNVFNEKVPEHTVKGILGRSVELESAVTPSLIFFIWNFMRQGIEKPRPIASGTKDTTNVHKDAVSLGDVSLTNSTLLISNLNAAAEGTFICQAFDEEDVTYIYIKLIVLVPVSKPLLRINNSAAIEGAPVMLTCLLRNGTGPIEYTWFRNTILEGTVPLAEANGSVVYFTAVNRTQIGWYTCTCKNEVNQETSDKVYLDVIYGPDDPVINIQPFAISETGFAANEKEEVSMTCIAASNPPCQYFWLYNNSQVYKGQMYVISKISRSQTGFYTCQAENVQLNTRTQLMISLTVY